MMKHLIYYIIFLLLITSSYASSLYISPKELVFDNVFIGGYAEQMITITTDSETSLEVTPVVSGDIGSWIYFEPSDTLKVKKDMLLSLKVIVRPPADSAIGSHSGDIVLIFTNELAPLIGKEREISFNIPITTTVTHDKITKLVINEIKAHNTEIGYPIDFIINAENFGNQEFAADVKVLMKENSSLHKIELKPTEKKEIVISLSSPNLTLGNHTATILVLLNKSVIKNETVSFGIKEKNSLLRKGVLLDIQNKKIVSEGREMSIYALFKNTGELSTTCFFEVQVLRQNGTISEVQSDPYYCLTSETTVLHAVFIPSAVGEYQIIGKVYYDTTVSDEKESSVQVVSYEKLVSAVPLSISPYLVFILIILFLFITRMILRKRINHET